MFSVFALLCSVALLLAGNGLLSILVVVRAGAEGFGPLGIGLVMSGYFVGFILGTSGSPLLIRRIGHIRAFSVLAAVAAIAALLYPIWSLQPVWIGLRILTGIALAGLCTVIESWLNTQADPAQRSRVFAAYMVVSLVALSLGQLLLNAQAAGGFVLFSVVAIMTSLAAIPVASTQLQQPVLLPGPPVRLRQVIVLAPGAAMGALLAGIVLGAFWSLGPAYASSVGLTRVQVSSFMSITILGGALMQFPIGRLSDRHDRRTALALVSGLGATLMPGLDAFRLYVLFFLIGGLTFALYPLCVAHLLDHLPADALLSGCSALLLLNGVGAAIGPLLAGATMQEVGPTALPMVFCVTLLLLAVITGSRRLLRVRTLLRHARFHPMLRTTPVALALLPQMTEQEFEKEVHHDQH
ncbi:MAG: MFS transporter [Pseudoxanthomonas sp.]